METENKYPKLNPEQQAAAFCEENAVVAAGAGSGKTMVLANRFTWLITEKGYKVDEILTLTFTKKAAAQMFKRIHSLLLKTSENETGIKASRAREALDDFIHARIQTHDSYSTTIVKQCAPRYGISPDFTIDQERCRQIALEESLPFLITHRNHPAVERLYANNRPKDIAGNIFANILFNYCQIDKTRDFIADVKTQFDIICTKWEKKSGELQVILKETENLIYEDNALLPDLVPVMDKYSKGKIITPECADIQKYFNYLLDMPEKSCIEKAEEHPLQKTMADLLEFLSDITGLSLRKGKRSDNRVKENIYKIRAIFGQFSSLAVSCMQAGFIISIMSLLAQLQSRYLSRKRAEGVLTFRDIASLARTILLEQQDIRQSEKEAFKAIIIDEFQDNNDLQKDILFLLAEKPDIINKNIPPAQDLSRGKLFFVGDEKQSIYQFRGADVSVFRKLKDEIKSADLPLKTNYRSAPALIGAFNTIFGGTNYDPNGKPPAAPQAFPSVFAPADSQLPLFEAAYTPLEAGSSAGGDFSRKNFSVCILNNKAEKHLCADENEARFVAEKIKQLLNEKYQPKDIAVLFRSRSPQYFFEKHLRLLDIPYTCEDINDFFYGGPVNDIMSVLRLAAYPLDSAAYAEMLRSPFAELSLPGTALCLSIFQQAENPQAFNDEPLRYLEKTDCEKYKCGQKIYSLICSKSANESISSLVSELWHNEGYRYETEWNSSVSVYREFYDYLFHLAVKADAANDGLAAFTDSMRSLRDSGGQLREVEIPLERPGAVHLMTIHKSKGLEFPVVFLCGCGKHSQSDRSGIVFFTNETGIVFSPPLPVICNAIPGIRNNFFWEQSVAQNKLKRTAELRRLFYVGMTRAEQEFYATGSLDIKDNKEEATDDFSLRIKHYTDEKCKKNENTIQGDSILNNDTFFGLMLPAIASHIPCGGLETGSGFFNLEEIPVYTEAYLKAHETKLSGYSNDQKGLNNYIKNTEAYYGNAEKIQTPELQDNHITPVSLRHIAKADPQGNFSGNNFFANNEFSGEKANDVFEKVDSLLAQFSQTGDDYTEKFSPSSFGTIAHICAEALLNKQEVVIPPSISGYLTPSQLDDLVDAGMELACRFLRSPLGKIAENAKVGLKRHESEFAFRSLVKNKTGEEVFINGNIDLFFEDENSFHIVDFKTDSKEMPGEHSAQLACYYQAVSSLFAAPANKKCRVWLYYLRTGHAVDMTEIVREFRLGEIAFEF